MAASVSQPALMSAKESVDRAYDAIGNADRSEVWIHLRSREDAMQEAARIDDAARHGEHLPLRGRTVAVKDNIDVAGLPTTLGLLTAVRSPNLDATAVRRLRTAGAVVLGKTNLDQFATGLVGTRSPYGPVRGSRQPERISGGSSSGSAVAVALNMVDIALGTDTAGSGRIPAALNRIVGVKPTLGTVSIGGMADACWPYDTVTTMSRDLDIAVQALAVMRNGSDTYGGERPVPDRRRMGAPERPVIAIPDINGLESLTASALVAWRTAVERLEVFGEVRVIDVRTLLEAARLLYGGAIVAGRYAAAGELIEASTGLDPTVESIVRAAKEPAGWEYVRDRRVLAAQQVAVAELLEGCDCLVTPTAPGHPTLAEVAADPVGVNSWLGTFTNFVNLLDLAAVAVPAGTIGQAGTEGDFGVSFVVRPFEDQIAVDLAARFLELPTAPLLDGEGIELAVFGAHLRGQPLNRQLLDAGARFVRNIDTAPEYRLYALDTSPAKPGLVRSQHGGTIAGELWLMSPGELGRFLAVLPEPMMLGAIELSDARTVVGFGCSPAAVAGARDITDFGGWLGYLAAQ